MEENIMDQGKMELLRIGADDAVELWKIQVEAFASLYEKYRHTATSPASQDTCRIHQWISGLLSLGVERDFQICRLFANCVSSFSNLPIWLKDILICCLAQHSRKVF